MMRSSKPAFTRQRVAPALAMRWGRLLLGLSLLLVAAACSTTPANIGVGLPGVDPTTGAYLVDTLTLRTSTVLRDSVITSNSNYLLVGRYVDPQLGTITARSYCALDFPALVPTELGVTPELERALRVSPVDALAADKLLVLLESEQAVRDCKPDLAAIARLPWQGVIVTARGQEVDFVSRFFAPAVGVDEDPVTGSAHCSLIPYWSRRLAKRMLTAQQLSARGGQLRCRLEGDRVSIAGRAVTVMRGQLLL